MPPPPPVPWRGRDAFWVALLSAGIGAALTLPLLLALPTDAVMVLFLPIGSLAMGGATALWVLLRRPAAFRALLGPKRRLLPARPYAAVGVAVVVFVVTTLAHGVLVAIWYVGTGVEPEVQQELWGLFDDAAGLRWLLAMDLALLTPIAEEVFFRGFLFQGMRRRGFWPAALVSSLIFGVAHWGGTAADLALLVPGAALTGLGACWLVERYRTLLPAVALHVAANAIPTAVMLLGGR